MPTRFKVRSGSSRALVTFLVAVLLPALALAGAGIRMIVQERSAAEAQFARTLDEAAGRAARELTQDLAWWQRCANDLPAGPVDLASVPARLGEALRAPGGAVVVMVDGDRVGASPRGQLLYLPVCTLAANEPPATVLDADAAVARQPHDAALDTYRRLMRANPPAAERVWLLERLARLAADRGNSAEARRAYDELGRAKGLTLGPVPADLAGRFGLCALLQRAGPPSAAVEEALAFGQDLAVGTWTLEKTRYSFYAGRARDWLAEAPGAGGQALAHLAELEAQRQPLTDAVERLVLGVRVGGARPGSIPVAGGLAFAFWRPPAAGSPPGALVVSPLYISASVLPAAFSAATRAALNLSLLSPDGTPVFQGEVGTDRRQDRTVSREVPVQGRLWRLDVSPAAGLVAVRQDLQRSERLHLAMLLLMVASLAFGIVTSARTLGKQLEIARARSEFASTVSHEFRSPLTGIRQLTEMLAAGRVATEGRRTEYYSMILEELDRLSAMVENVLGFARARRHGAVRAADTEMSSWLQEVIERYRHSPVAAGVSIEASIPAALPRVAIDRDGLARAVGNLLDNAVKYSPGEKTVWIKAEAAGSDVVIRVRDRGIGIHAQDQPHVCERFVRGRGEAVEAVAGTGLGLSLVQEVVSAHGGAIAIDSRPGEGTTVTIRIGGLA